MRSALELSKTTGIVTIPVLVSWFVVNQDSYIDALAGGRSNSSHAPHVIGQALALPVEEQNADDRYEPTLDELVNICCQVLNGTVIIIVLYSVVYDPSLFCRFHPLVARTESTAESKHVDGSSTLAHPGAWTWADSATCSTKISSRGILPVGLARRHKARRLAIAAWTRSPSATVESSTSPGSAIPDTIERM